MTDEYPYELSPKRLASEMSVLWTVSQFFTSLQATMLQTERSTTVNMRELYQRVEAIRTVPAQIPMVVLAETAQKLHQARIEISMIDLQLPPAIFRRFFERVTSYDRTLLRNIVRYYITKSPKNDQDRDKLDLLATRLCTHFFQNEQGIKVMSVLENTRQLLEDCFPGSAADYPPVNIQEATLLTLRKLARSITEVRNFNTLIEGKLVTQMRQTKIELGENFYTPAILNEVVHINVIVHNKFQELYGMEQARLRMESARLMRSSLATGRHVALGSTPRHPTLTQMNELTIQMQRLMQDFKQDMATRALNDRQIRLNLEDDNMGLANLIRNLEDSLRRSRELMEEVQGRLLKLSSTEE
ncbi:MAG: hypothetical protein K1Y36_06160 [Blastocatellia bacterium]|nr:hypothetical protein [Blastocatellia bacterium]